MSPGEKCSLLLMRDDGRSFRRRISMRVLCALCLMAGMLPLLLGASGWLAWILYEDNAALNIQQRQMEQENKTLSAALKRLSNLEQLLDMPENARLLAMQNRQTKLKVAQQAALSPAAPPQDAPGDQNQGDAISLDPAASSQLSSTPSVDMKLVGVENVHVRNVGSKLRISLDLHNSQQKRQLVGYVGCTAKNMEGESFLLEIPKEIAAFRINRFKRAVFVPALPAAVQNISMFSVVIEIHLEERGIVYRNEYPVERRN